MSTLVTVIHIVVCVLLVLVVMIQSGKGAEISATLGGSSNTIFGTSGGANILTRITSVLAAIFMFTSLGLTLLGSETRKSVFENAPATQAPTGPQTQKSK
jgi:preprotein translocase subunit SecG